MSTVAALTPRPARWALTLAALCGLCAARTAQADVALPALLVEGACPAAARVAALLGTVLPAPLRESERDAAVEVVDLGVQYRVTIAGVSRDYGDPGRDCDERARVAAIFTALTLRPPALAGGPVPPLPESAVVAAAPAAIVAARNADPAWLLAVAAGLEHASAIETGTWLSLRAGASWSRLGITAGLGLHPAVIQTLPKGSGARALSAAVSRLSFDGGIELGESWAGHRLALAVGPALQIAAVEADGDLEDARGRVRALAAARVGLSWAARPFFGVRPYLLAAVWWHPRPLALRVEPRGEVGETPRLWLGLGLGLAMDVGGVGVKKGRAP